MSLCYLGYKTTQNVLLRLLVLDVMSLVKERKEKEILGRKFHFESESLKQCSFKGALADQTLVRIQVPKLENVAISTMYVLGQSKFEDSS